MVSTRADIVTRRTYCRPLDDAGTQFETWPQVIARVINHQRWLWERAQGRRLNVEQETELAELSSLMLSRRALVAGRTLWLGGTEIVQRRESANFNCSFQKVSTVHDLVDSLWLLEQGCGLGSRPVKGTLNGFANVIPELEIIQSTRGPNEKGRPTNHESWDPSTGTWTIQVGDSAEGWAKAIGKLFAGKFPARKLVWDTSEVRGPGGRLKGYGWISQGDTLLVKAVRSIFNILNSRAGQLLSAIDILDTLDWFGTILATRRSAEIVLYPWLGEEWEAFARAKHNYWINNVHRAQSNNSLLFFEKPSKQALGSIFDTIIEMGGSDPGLYNASAAIERAPWFKGTNPCGEILLGDKSFCNLVEVDLGKFANRPEAELHRALYIIARANYRQTCVNLDDGILQRAWHENNEFLRLCGVGLTGIVQYPNATPYTLRVLRNYAIAGAYSMADELHMPRPKNVTTIKPSGTLSKIMDTTEGIHKPLGRYIFNNINFGEHDPLLPALEAAGYNIFTNPNDPSGRLVTFPIAYDGIQFSTVGGREVNLETAVQQLDRYKLFMENYVDHNASITVSYDIGERQEIVDWLDKNWSSYVGVSFLFRNDPTKTAADLGHPYLPQEVVDKNKFMEYSTKLKPISLDGIQGEDLIDDQCAGGACPVR